MALEKTTRLSPGVATTVGFAAAFVAVALLAAAGAVLRANHRAANRQRSWNLKDAVLFARDIPVGVTLAATDLEVGQVPEQLATASTSARVSDVAGKTLAVSVVRGQLASRATVTTAALSPACAAFVRDRALEKKALKDPDVQAFLEVLERRVKEAR
jgi:Flp pilus assembly protein CpaB